MTNVVQLNAPARATSETSPVNALLTCFAQHRRGEDDVFWLKENAEVLNVLATSGTLLSDLALDPYRHIYQGLEERLRFFPQYYRFLLSICLDLEDLGMPGNLGETLCAQTARAGLPEAELSDLQRAEARRLLARRGMAPFKEKETDI